MKANLFKNCKVEYAHNQKENVYSVKVIMEGKPRIITVRVGDKFAELSLADQKGNIIEVLRQEDGKGVRFSKSE